MMTRTPLILAAISTLALSACVDPNAPMGTQTRQGATIGGLVGAVAGAATASDGNELRGALIGGALGAGSGAAIGSALDRQAAELRATLPSYITIANNGEFLVVNMPQDLLFETNSAALRPELRRDLQSIAASISRYPDTRIEVIGHTDNTGSAAFNQDLSQRRASSVGNVLRDSGVPPSRLVTFGRGEEQPIASNLTPEGRAQNRRVEIIIRPIR
jgi:outer membrane protein OmpA-like peptidoglycan-associated protein